VRGQDLVCVLSSILPSKKHDETAVCSQTEGWERARKGVFSIRARTARKSFSFCAA